MSVWGGTAVASIIGGWMGQQNVNATNATNMAINKQTEDWETQMSDTAMQRRVQDLDAAGLNPMLAVGQGGASTPGFSPIAMQSSNALGQGIAQAGASAGQIQQQWTALENMKADTAVKTATANKLDSETPDNPNLVKNNLSYLSSAQTQNALQALGIQRMTLQQAAAQLGMTEAQTNLIAAQIPGALANSQISRMDADTQRQLMSGLVNTALMQQKVATTSGRNIQEFQNSPWGRFLNAVGFGPAPPTGSNQASGNFMNAARGVAEFVK